MCHILFNNHIVYKCLKPIKSILAMVNLNSIATLFIARVIHNNCKKVLMFVFNEK